MISLLVASFVAGGLTILVPCILPLIPVVVGGSILSSNGRRRNPYIIIGSLLLSIIVFTVIIQTLTNFIFIPNSFWENIAAGLVLFVGLIFLFPSLWHRIPFVSNFAIFSNKAVGAGIKRNTIFGDAIIGIALGPLFSSCSPTYLLILSVILPASFFLGLLYLISFVLGLGVTLLLISLIGQRLVSRLNIVADENGYLKKILGLIMVFIAIVIFFGLDKQFAIFLLDIGFIDITQFEFEF